MDDFIKKQKAEYRVEKNSLRDYFAHNIGKEHHFGHNFGKGHHFGKRTLLGYYRSLYSCPKPLMSLLPLVKLKVMSVNLFFYFESINVEL